MFRRILVWMGSLLAIAILVGLAIVAAWFVDEEIMYDDAVPRNVTLGGFAVGGFDQTALDAVLDVVAADVASTPLSVEAAPRTFETTNESAGISLDIAAMRTEALSLGREGNVRDRFESWWESLFTMRSIEPTYTYEPASTVTWLDAHAARVLTHPSEPSFTGANGKIEVVDGIVGEQLDAQDVAAQVSQAVTVGHPPFTTSTQWVPLEPAVSAETLEQAVEEADSLADTALTVRVGTETLRLGKETIRRWIDSERNGNSLAPVLSLDRIEASMERVLSGVTTEAVPPEFEVVDGEVVVALGVPAEQCCGDGVGELVSDVLLTDSNEVVAVPLVPVETPEAQAANYGIRELVAEFTTNHACCQSRVNNIQRMADIVRGAVILPGESLSLNEHVGERTRASGFVPAGTILSGRLVDTVGGGVSQFATTTFNAAFFAGLDFLEYQSHSIYISRYPYGREATINYPNVDLRLENNTPYAAMLWTEYTGTSITVQVWSTPHFEVEQTGQSRGGVGQCTRVTTFRSRTPPDGEPIEDSVFAVYRPGEGLDCNGNPTPDPFG